MIPQSAWSTPAAKILPYIPAPTLAGSVNNYENNSGRNIVDDDKIGERVDFNNKLTGNWSWYYTYDDANTPTALVAAGDGATVAGFPSTSIDHAQQFVMSNTHTFGATAVNEARFSFFRTALHKDNPTGSFASLSSLGFVTGAGTLGIIPDTTPNYPQYVPQIIFNNYTIGVPPLNTYQPNNTFMVSDVFSKSAGKHTWKFGGEFRYLQINERNYANPNGGFVFNGTVTGSDFADYLLGRAGDTQRLHASDLTVAGLANEVRRRVRARLLEGDTQSDAEPGLALGSEHAMVRHTRKDPDV